MSEPLVTPEAVALDLEPATVGSRGVAMAIDYALLFAGFLLLGAAEAAFGLTGYVPDWLGIAAVLLLVFAWQFGYPVGFETLLRGRTPGKAALGLRVVTQEGGPVRFRHAAVRAAVGVVELLGTFGIVAVISSFSSARGQRLGDLAAGTLVVRERRAGGVPRAQSYPIPPGLDGYVRALDVSGLSSGDLETVREVLRRPLPPDARQQVAGEVAGALAPRVRPAPPHGVGAVTWLQAIAARMQVGNAGVVGPTVGRSPGAMAGGGLPPGGERVPPARSGAPAASEGGGRARASTPDRSVSSPSAEVGDGDEDPATRFQPPT